MRCGNHNKSFLGHKYDFKWGLCREYNCWITCLTVQQAFRYWTMLDNSAKATIGSTPSRCNILTTNNLFRLNFVCPSCWKWIHRKWKSIYSRLLSLHFVCSALLSALPLARRIQLVHSILAIKPSFFLLLALRPRRNSGHLLYQWHNRYWLHTFHRHSTQCRKWSIGL